MLPQREQSLWALTKGTKTEGQTHRDNTQTESRPAPKTHREMLKPPPSPLQTRDMWTLRGVVFWGPVIKDRRLISFLFRDDWP